MGLFIYYGLYRDSKRMDALPDDPAEQAAFALLMNVYGIAIRKRFPDDASRRGIGAFSQMVYDAWADDDVKMSAQDITTMIAQSLLDRSGPNKDLFDHQQMTNAWGQIVFRAVEEIGMPSGEVIEMIRDAEIITEQQGFSPTPVSSAP